LQAQYNRVLPHELQDVIGIRLQNLLCISVFIIKKNDTSLRLRTVPTGLVNAHPKSLRQLVTQSYHSLIQPHFSQIDRLEFLFGQLDEL
jgi:hypothetical protein